MNGTRHISDHSPSGPPARCRVYSLNAPSSKKADSSWPGFGNSVLNQDICARCHAWRTNTSFPWGYSPFLEGAPAPDPYNTLFPQDSSLSRDTSVPNDISVPNDTSAASNPSISQSASASAQHLVQLDIRVLDTISAALSLIPGRSETILTSYREGIVGNDDREGRTTGTRTTSNAD